MELITSAFRCELGHDGSATGCSRCSRPKPVAQPCGTIHQMNCRICGRELGREDDPLSLDCGGDCWGCIGEIEAEMGSESSLARIREEAAQGFRPSWKAPAEQPPSARS